jgi:AraC-like DNA-binding protein
MHRTRDVPELDDVRVTVETPREALRPYVKRLLVVEASAAHQDAHLPDTGLVAAFRFRGDCLLEEGSRSAPTAAVTGLWDTVRTHQHSGDHAAVIVSFTAVGAAAWLRRPLDEFANTTIDLRAVLDRPSEWDALADRLAVAPDHAHRLRMVEELLLTRVGQTQPDPLMSAAAAFIERTQGTIRIHELTRRIGLSQSALERRFRRRVGTSPRRFASIVRLKNVVRLHAGGADLTTIAHAAGYCDQAHFIKDFKRFAGVPPATYFARADR